MCLMAFVFVVFFQRNKQMIENVLNPYYANPSGFAGEV